MGVELQQNKRNGFRWHFCNVLTTGYYSGKARPCLWAKTFPGFSKTLARGVQCQLNAIWYDGSVHCPAFLLTSPDKGSQNGIIRLRYFEPNWQNGQPIGKALEVIP